MITAEKTIHDICVLQKKIIKELAGNGNMDRVYEYVDRQKKLLKAYTEEIARWAFMAGESSYDMGDMTFNEYWKQTIK